MLEVVVISSFWFFVSICFLNIKKKLIFNYIVFYLLIFCYGMFLLSNFNICFLFVVIFGFGVVLIDVK